jgi:hypothetical protein
MLAAIHNDVTKIPSIPPSYTPAPTENTTTFDSLHLHRIFGCRRFKNQLHITSASQNAELIKYWRFYNNKQSGQRQTSYQTAQIFGQSTYGHSFW